MDADGGELVVDGVSKNTKAWTGTAGATTETTNLQIGIYDTRYIVADIYLEEAIGTSLPVANLLNWHNQTRHLFRV